MNDNAKKWVQVLRNGAYQQGVGQLLNNHEEYCCLGVLCDLYIKETGKGKWDDGNPSLPHMNGYFPEEVAIWAGLTNTEDSVEILVKNNDSGVPFPVIADIIESEPEGLFA